MKRTRRRVTTTVLSFQDRDGNRIPSGRIVIHEGWVGFEDGWGYWTRSITISFPWLRNHPERYGF